jgi:pre-mRNA-splicing helicase BRR2
MNMDDDLRDKLVQVSEEQMERLAGVCNRYPIVEIRCNTDRASDKDPIGVFAPSEGVNLTVTISRDEEDAESLSVFKAPVFAQYYPQRKFEEWWVVVGSTQTGRLLAIKKISNFREQA